jgi:protoporphyrinogen oxidase
MKKVAILGGGFAGLTAAYYEAKKGNNVTLFEKEDVLGGLAAGFSAPGWEWPLERAYHHLFTNDADILGFSKEIGFEDFIYKTLITASLYDSKEVVYGQKSHNYRIFPVDTPQDLLRFPLMSWPAKIRTGMVAFLFKLTPMLSFYEKRTASQILRQGSGEEGWRVFWEPLLQKKFGKYADEVLASFIWTRIHKRTKDLIYIKGGFQTLIDYIQKIDQRTGIILSQGSQIDTITKKDEKFRLVGKTKNKKIDEQFDVVVSTLPTAIMTRVTSELFPRSYLDRFKKLDYMHAVNLILETEEPIHEKVYWLSCCVKEFPFLVTLQHTNLIDKKHYGGKHVLYIGNYVDGESNLLKMDKQETIDYILPYLEKFSANKITITNSFHFKAGFAQPIFNKTFVKNKPDFETPIKNFYIANMDMTYPYDRGTNYAVALGKEVSRRIG